MRPSRASVGRASTSFCSQHRFVDLRSATANQTRVSSSKKRQQRQRCPLRIAPKAASSSTRVKEEEEEKEKEEEYSKAALTARLSNYCYKTNLEELLESDGYELVWDKFTDVTRVYVADRKIGDDDVPQALERFIVARGAVWGDNQNVDRMRLSNQISKVWPTQVHPDV